MPLNDLPTVRDLNQNSKISYVLPAHDLSFLVYLLIDVTVFIIIIIISYGIMEC